MPNGKPQRNIEPTWKANTVEPSASPRVLPSTRQRGSTFWRDMSDTDIAQFVKGLCDDGYAIVLGRTSDGGALSVTILDGSKRIKEYPTSAADFHDLVDWALSGI